MSDFDFSGPSGHTVDEHEQPIAPVCTTSIPPIESMAPPIWTPDGADPLAPKGPGPGLFATAGVEDAPAPLMTEAEKKQHADEAALVAKGGHFSGDGAPSADSVLPSWDEFSSGVHSAQRWVNNKSEGAATSAVDWINEKGHQVGFPGTASVVGAVAGSAIETVGKVGGGLALAGPSTVTSVAEAPDKIGHGMYDIYNGHQHGMWDPEVEGTGEILEGLGDVASAGLLAESGFQAARTRGAIAAATAPAPDGTSLNLEGPKPTTGTSSGTAYHRILEEPATGKDLSKTTTIISDEGVLVRQHSDFYPKPVPPPGPAAGPWAARGKVGPTSELLPPEATVPAGKMRHFPDAWTGAVDVPGRTAPTFARTGTQMVDGAGRQVASDAGNDSDAADRD